MDKRLLFGSDFGTGDRAVGFLSNQNFHEGNLIIWQPSTLRRELSPQAQTVASNSAVATLSSRLDHLAQWVTEGNTLILIGHAPLPYRYKASANNILTGSLEKHQPLDGIKFKSAGGNRVEYCGPIAAADLLGKHLSALRYDVLLSGDGLVPLLRVALGGRGTPQIVGGYRFFGDGLIIYLPPITGDAAHLASYINDASRLREALLRSPSEAPEWVDQYRSTGDKEVFDKVATLTQQLNELRDGLAIQEALIEKSRDLKRLIFDTGDGFAAAVATALAELGLSVVEGPHPRADLLGSNGARFAAIEAKGIEGTTKEKDVREVIQWMAEVESALAGVGESNDPDLARYANQLAKLSIERDGSDCKGLLIMGTFRKLPLSERIQPSFPEPVTRVLHRADVCALTGAQLLGLVLQAREDPSLKQVILRELFETRGVLSRASVWNEFLTTEEV